MTKTFFEWIRQRSINLRWWVLAIAILIGISSVMYTNMIVKELVAREQKKIDLFAKSQSFLTQTEDSESRSFLLTEIIEENSSIPVLLTDDEMQPFYFRNMEEPEFSSEKEKNEYWDEIRKEMSHQHKPIIVEFDGGFKQYIYYENSKLIQQLRYYPYVQLSVIAIFGLLVYLIYNASRNAEQNRVWVGLAKETAHQLGTPLSSLMAWVEWFKVDESLDPDTIGELQKDIDRLKTVTERFSNIGSVPVLEKENASLVAQRVIHYLEKRVSQKVKFTLDLRGEDFNVNMNVPLFEWVLENICKNAVDAMEGRGMIAIELIEKGKIIEIDISDNGKGIAKNNIHKVFKPGFTTKKRGWGLGLTLVKRIVENYHKGKIYVKNSEEGIGTTFTLKLLKQ